MSDNIGILIEYLNSKFDAVIELVGQMRQDMKTLAKQEDLEEVKRDIKVIKAAVTDLSHQVDKHEKQLAQLEAA